jgi:hypothetical protein
MGGKEGGINHYNFGCPNENNKLVATPFGLRIAQILDPLEASYRADNYVNVILLYCKLIYSIICIEAKRKSIKMNKY